MRTVQDEMNVDVTRKQSKSLVGNVILFLIALSPVIYIGWLISATAVNVLKFDEWSYVYLFRHLASHTLTARDLLAQHNESRPLLQRLIILGVGVFTHWDVRWDMWIEFAFVCVISLNIYLLSRRVTGMSRRQCLFLWIITNVLLFSAEQSQNWTWGFQMIIPMPMLFISAAMLVAYSRLERDMEIRGGDRAGDGGDVFVCHRADHLDHPASAADRWITAADATIYLAKFAAWGIAWAANLWVYYHGYYKPPWHPSLLLRAEIPDSRRCSISRPIWAWRWCRDITTFGCPSSLEWSCSDAWRALARIYGEFDGNRGSSNPRRRGSCSAPTRWPAMAPPRPDASDSA